MNNIKLDNDVLVDFIDDLLVALDEHIPIVKRKDSEFYGHKRVHRTDLVPRCVCLIPLKHGEFDWYTYDHETGWFTSKTNRLEK